MTTRPYPISTGSAPFDGTLNRYLHSQFNTFNTAGSYTPTLTPLDPVLSSVIDHPIIFVGKYTDSSSGYNDGLVNITVTGSVYNRNVGQPIDSLTPFDADKTLCVMEADSLNKLAGIVTRNLVSKNTIKECIIKLNRVSEEVCANIHRGLDENTPGLIEEIINQCTLDIQEILDDIEGI